MVSDEQLQETIDLIFGKEIPRIVGGFICVYSNFEWDIMLLTRYLLKRWEQDTDVYFLVANEKLGSQSKTDILQALYSEWVKTQVPIPVFERVLGGSGKFREMRNQIAHRLITLGKTGDVSHMYISINKKGIDFKTPPFDEEKCLQLTKEMFVLVSEMDDFLRESSPPNNDKP